MKKEMDVLVIGGGAIGVCSAYYLTEKGLRVSVVEQGEIASGCSGANAGLIVPSYVIPLASPYALRRGLRWILKPESPFYVKPRFDLALFRWLRQFRKSSKFPKMLHGIQVLRDLNYASMELFDRLIKGESLTCNYRKDGWLMVYKTRQGFKEALEETNLMEDHNIDFKILSVDETLKMEPTLQAEISGGIFFPEDSHLDPEKFVRALAARLQEWGVNIITKTEVLEFETSNGNIKTARTTRGDLQPKQIVLAAGAWSPGILKNLGLRLPLQAAKGYSISIIRPEACPITPLYLSEANVAVTPLENSLRFGGTMELTGMDFEINFGRVDTIMRAARDYLGQVENLDVGKIKCGLRPCTPDGLPIIDRSPGYKNLIIATGHGMLGITQAPITGRLISQLACEQTPEVDLTPLRLNRF